MTIDYSIVLNLHNEAPYLKRTMMSLAQAAEFARYKGLRSELILVLDSADEATRQWVANADYSEFDAHKVLEVQNRSLGLSRNDGIAAATGEYITTADADDLVSYNFFVVLVDTLRARGRKTIVCPEHVYSFGDRSYWGLYTSSEDVTNIMLFGSNTYVSRVGCHRSVFEEIPFIDARGGLKAFEDWHFNCEAIAAGYRFDVAKNTILFYRQRRNSIMTSAQGRIIPFSRFFMPDVFTQVCEKDYQRINGKSWFEGLDSRQLRRYILGSSVLLELIASANIIEPKIEYNQLQSMNVGFAKGSSLAPGGAYFEACRKLGNAQFTDIVLFPFVSRGGGEKYILDVIKGLLKVDPNRRILMLSGEQYASHALDMLPEQCTFIDLYEICSRWQLNDIYHITLRLIQAIGNTSLLHIKACPYAFTFFDRYGSELENTAVFYYFCESASSVRGVGIADGNGLHFISENASQLSYVISDQKASIQYATDRLSLDRLSLSTLYAKCETTLNPGSLKPFIPRKRLLWASRLDYQKRPELIALIAARLLDYDRSISIDVYGTSVFEDGSSGMSTLPNVNYKGGFKRFADLNPADYDALVYTSRFDGLPNILLEAMSEGLLVMAPDVGGISEIVINDETGLLLDNSFDDAVLADRYMETIKKLYEKTIDVDRLRTGALTLVLERHSEQAYLRRINEIFTADESHA